MAGSSAKLPDKQDGGGRADEHERLHTGQRSQGQGEGGQGVSGSRDGEGKPRHHPAEHRPGVLYPRATSRSNWVAPSNATAPKAAAPTPARRRARTADSAMAVA